MNKRFFIHQITIYHFNYDESVTKSLFDEVYFRYNKKSGLIDKGLEKGSTGSITIPTTKKLDIHIDDYVVEGIIEDEFDLRELLKKYQIFKVVSVDDNRKGGLQHYKIEVSE